MDPSNEKRASHQEVETDGSRPQKDAEDLKAMGNDDDLDVGAQVIHGQETAFTKEGWSRRSHCGVPFPFSTLITE